MVIWGMIGFALLQGVMAVSAAHAATVKGQVIFQGEIPPSQQVEVNRDREFCGEFLTFQPVVVRQPEGGLQGVVVNLEGVVAPTQARKLETVVINTGCRFAPRISAAQTSQFLRLENHDPLLHNTHIRLNNRTFVNIALVAGGHPIKKRMKRSGLMEVKCDAHKFMKAYVRVFEHPFYAVTHENGSFTISNVPAGEYQLVSWHESLGEIRQPIVVPDSGEVTLRIEYPGQ